MEVAKNVQILGQTCVFYEFFGLKGFKNENFEKKNSDLKKA